MINSELMKSFESCEIASKASSSKSNSAFVILVNVSASLSPINGERPDKLEIKTDSIEKRVEKKTAIAKKKETLQDITYNTDGPHVGLQTDWFVTDDLRRYKLGRAEKHPDGFVGLDFLRQSKVD